MKRPRFFCEHCGAEVGRDERACPRCGRFFASVRCPACGFSGEERLFATGCPACGYSAPPTRAAPRQRPRVPAGKLPLWVYILTVCALLCAFAALLVFVGRG